MRHAGQPSVTIVGVGGNLPTGAVEVCTRDITSRVNVIVCPFAWVDLRFTLNSGQVVVWSGSHGDHRLGLFGELLLVL